MERGWVGVGPMGLGWGTCSCAAAAAAAAAASGYRRQQKPPLPLYKKATLQALEAFLEPSSTPSAHCAPAHKHSPAAPVGRQAGRLESADGAGAALRGAKAGVDCDLQCSGSRRGVSGRTEKHGVGGRCARCAADKRQACSAASILARQQQHPTRADSQ